MQYIVGSALISVLIGIFMIPISKYEKNGAQKTVTVSYPRQTRRKAATNKYSIKSVSARKGRGFVARKIRRFARVLRKSPKSVQQILAASEALGVPVDVALAHWSLESNMASSGDPGRNSALWELNRNIRQDKRRRGQFKKNKIAFLRICQKCGYHKRFGVNCRNMKGSSTGALGPMQFMPYTWGNPTRRRDLDGDGVGCPLQLAEAFYASAEKLRKHAEFAIRHSMNWKIIPKKEKVTVHSPIPVGLLETEWDFAMLRYAGNYCKHNYDYVRRAKRLRPHLCRMVREATGQNLSCSIEPKPLLASN